MSRHVSHKSLGGALTRPAGHQGENARSRIAARRDGIIQRVFRASFLLALLRPRYFPCEIFLFRITFLIFLCLFFFFLLLIDLLRRFCLRIMIFGMCFGSWSYMYACLYISSVRNIGLLLGDYFVNEIEISKE